jgi:glucose-6-phosphate isomerase
MSQLTQSKPWRKLVAHQAVMQTTAMVSGASGFAQEADRGDDFSLEAAGLYLNYAKHRMVKETRDLLIELAESVDLKGQIAGLFQGGLVNFTQGLPACHTVLRDPGASSAVQRSLLQMSTLAEAIHTGAWRGATGEVLTDVVNIGIGGSDLGPRIVVNALQGACAKTRKLRCHFVSNMDPSDIRQTLADLRPESTLFVVTSKSFLTHETQQNSRLAQTWLEEKLGRQDITQHLVAVTAYPERAMAQGIPEAHVLSMPMTVGGRFSLWSAAGVSVVLSLGMPAFYALLSGAYAMDLHCQQAPFEQNMPVLLALIGIWYINFWGARSHAILPYSQSLRHLSSYLQQLEMESNGKQVNRAGQMIDYDTAPVIWGGVGSNSQHAFHQQLLQGSGLVPIDFIAPINGYYQDKQARKQQRLLLTNCFSQSHVLFHGSPADRSTTHHAYAAHQHVPGNAPSSTILMPQLTPKTLGALLALYEHKAFIQSAIWDINAFDQWGVELGKQQAEQFDEALTSNTLSEGDTHDLMRYFKQHWQQPA